MTLQQQLEQAHQRLQAAGVCFGHGTSNAYDEAAWLVLWRLGLPLQALDENAGRQLTVAEVQAVEALVEHRISERGTMTCSSTKKGTPCSQASPVR